MTNRGIYLRGQMENVRPGGKGRKRDATRAQLVVRRCCRRAEDLT
jgi:hypothetical protein